MTIFLRPLSFTRNYSAYAAGSVLISCGNTKVICTASIEEKVPSFLKGKQQGWLTAEYSMLPSATHTRGSREAVKGKQSGRTQEIQRLIGRSLRSALDLGLLGERQILIDCDVIQADGGTRVASINGACLALCDALWQLKQQGLITHNPLKAWIGAISVGVVAGQNIIDLNYEQDSNCDTDMNLIMNEQKQIIEVQATAEQQPLPVEQFNQLLELGSNAIVDIIQLSKAQLSTEQLAFLQSDKQA